MCLQGVRQTGSRSSGYSGGSFPDLTITVALAVPSFIVIVTMAVPTDRAVT